MYKIIIAIVFVCNLFSQLKIGDDAPTFFSKTLENKYFFLSDYLEGNSSPIVLSFFATWCVPCRIELPILDSLSQHYKNTKFYLVNVGGVKDKQKQKQVTVETFLKELDIELPVLIDKYANVAIKYEGLILPRIVIIDANGKIAYLKTGYEVGDENKLIEILDKLDKKNE